MELCRRVITARMCLQLLRAPPALALATRLLRPAAVTGSVFSAIKPFGLVRSNATNAASVKDNVQPPAPAETDPPTAGATNVVTPLTGVNFEAFVLKSNSPVVVFCHAEWHGPSNEMAPLLIRAVQDTKGAVRLGVLDVDANMELAQALQLKDLPTVFATYKGRPAGRFSGVATEANIKAFVDSLLKLGGSQTASKIIEDADACLKNKDLQGAVQLFSHLLADESLKAKPEALSGLVRCALADGDLESARMLADTLRKECKDDLNNREVKKAMAALALAEQGTPASGETAAAESDLRRKVETSPDDLQARYDLAVLQNTSGKHQEAIDQCFEIIKRDKHWNNNAAREFLLRMFAAIGHKEDVVKKNSRRLANLWFL